MSSDIWTSAAVASSADQYDSTTYRFTSSDGKAAIQEVSNSARTVEIVEGILYQYRSRISVQSEKLHRMLATPFERTDLIRQTRFRGPQDPGVYYCAETVETAACEFSFHRLMHFLKDSPELNRLESSIIQITCDVSTLGVDIRFPPYSKYNRELQSKSDYSLTQKVGRSARAAGVGAVIYTSARGETSGACVALLNPSAFKNPQRLSLKYSWHLTVFENRALLSDSESSKLLEFEYSERHGFVID
jgi:hypothetical protein